MVTSPCCQTHSFVGLKVQIYSLYMICVLNEMDLSLQLKTRYKLHIVIVAMANNYHYLMITYETIKYQGKSSC